MNNNYLSLETCKRLKEWGCDLGGEQDWVKWNSLASMGKGWTLAVKSSTDAYKHVVDETYPAYHWYDVLVTHAKEFFGEDLKNKEESFAAALSLQSRGQRFSLVANTLLCFLQQNKHKEAEEYLLSNVVFNPENNDIR